MATTFGIPLRHEAYMKQQSTEAADPVNNPPHYNQGDIEAIDAIEAALGPEGFKAYCRGNAIKYLWRAELKHDNQEDWAKANWYINRAVSNKAVDTTRTNTEHQIPQEKDN